jgi:ketosteroid isomerase-like protein
MATSPLAGRLEDAYAAFVRGEPASLLALLDASAVYPLPGAHLGGGRLEGRDAIMRRLVAAAQACDAPPEVELLGASGDDAVVVTAERFRASRRGTSLDQRVDVTWRFERGRCVDIRAHFEDQRACDAFWNGWEP